MADAGDPIVAERLDRYRVEASSCTRCAEKSLLHVDPNRGCAKPLSHLESSFSAHILAIAEAPNWDDTFNPEKGGRGAAEVADRVGGHVSMVYEWIQRFGESGFRTFEQAPNPKGRPPIITGLQIRELIDIALSNPSADSW